MKASVTDYAQALYETVKTDRNQVRAAIGRLILKLQADRKRHWLPLIVDALEHIEQNEENRLVVTVESARPLTESEKQTISQPVKKNYPDKEVMLRETVEPSLIGGVKLTVNDRIIDHTIKTQLELLQSRL